MDADTKVKELEEEFKILKAEIKNVLLDIREVILENNNPLGDDHQGAFIRMDLNTTARAVAAGELAHEAAKAADDAREEDSEQHAGPPPDHPGVKTVRAVDLEADDQDGGETPESTAPDTEPGIEPVTPEAADSASSGEDEPAPGVLKRNYREHPMPDLDDNPTTEIPPMYRAGPHSLDMTPPLSDWLAEALTAVGPRELERIIAIERLWGNLPPNIGRALGYLQELLRATDDANADPSWLRLMRDLDRLSVI